MEDFSIHDEVDQSNNSFETIFHPQSSIDYNEGRGVSRGEDLGVQTPPQPLAQGELGSTFCNSWDRPYSEHLPPNNPGYAP